MKRQLRATFLGRFAAPFATLLLLSVGTVLSAGCGGEPGASTSGSSSGDMSTSTSTSTGSGQGGDGGGGGGGGTTACTDASSCPGQDTDCQTRTCNNGQCGVEFTPKDTPLSDQTPGDCKTAVCDGNGGVTSADDSADVLDDKNPCTDDLCNAGGPVNVPSMVDTPCSAAGGALCDGNGACVECLEASDCSSGICDTQNHKCVAATCVDGVKNGTETDLDCGGASCSPCADGGACSVGSDCSSQVCTGNVCQAPTCSDGAKNGTETDADCGGGNCGPCPTGKGCGSDADCLGGLCSGSVCVATCSDTEENQGETDVDCGGPNCGPCADGKGCDAATDCSSQVCTGNVCQAPTCTDAVKNGAETDVDCGGGTCGPCADGQGCAGAADCSSQVCTGNVCQVPTCTDAVKNGTETDVDCGGATCGFCGPGQGCGVGADCSSQLCQAGVCTTPVCGDGVNLPPDACDDANTTDGDGCSSTCAVEPGFNCSGTPSVCVTTCGDGIKAGAEACDDGNTTDGDGCTSACAVQTGYSCAGSPSVCATICGDGLIVGGEQCDDGNQNTSDGCTSACAVSPGFTCTGAPSVCVTTCGDGIKAGAEGCDDGNTASGDGCASACTVEPGYTCTGTPSVCTGFEVELNNTPATANDFAALSVGGKINGQIKPAGEKDYFMITVPAGQVIALNAQTVDNFLGVACTSNTIDTVLTIFNAAGAQIGNNDDIASTNHCSSVSLPALAAGQYFIEVKAFSATATPSYTLQVTLSPCGDGIQGPGEQCDDGNTTNGDGCSSVCRVEPNPEMEVNNTCPQANGPFALQANAGAAVLVSGSITPAADIDFYSFTIPVIADVKFETFDSTGPGSCAPSSVDTEIQVIAPDCTTSVTAVKDQGGIANCSKIDPSTEPLVRHLAPGTYFVKVFPFSATATFSYTLQVSLVSACGNGIKEGSEQCDGGSNCDAACQIIPTCGDGILSGTEICDDGNLTNGDGCSSTCQIEGGVPNEVEPNNTVAQASANGVEIKTGGAFVGSIGVDGDKDLYKVNVLNQSTIRFETFDNATLSDCVSAATNVRLLDSAGVLLKSDTGASGIGPCGALVVNLAPGIYYVQVERSSAGTIAKYFLETKFITDAGAETEPNDTQAQANAVAGAEMFVFGGHQVVTDLDFYAITVPAGASIRAETIEGDTGETCESNGIDSTLVLFNASGTNLGNDGDDGRGFCSMIDGTGAVPRDAFAHNLAAGTYFLQVKSFSTTVNNGNQFNYRLVVTIR